MIENLVEQLQSIGNTPVWAIVTYEFEMKGGTNHLRAPKESPFIKRVTNRVLLNCYNSHEYMDAVRETTGQDGTKYMNTPNWKEFVGDSCCLCQHKTNKTQYVEFAANPVNAEIEYLMNGIHISREAIEKSLPPSKSIDALMVNRVKIESIKHMIIH